MSRLSNGVFQMLKPGDIVFANDRKTKVVIIENLLYDLEDIQRMLFIKDEEGKEGFIQQKHVGGIVIKTEKLCKDCITNMVCKKQRHALDCYKRRNQK